MIGQVSERLRDMVRQIFQANEVTIVEGHVSKDHVHLMVSASPSLSINKPVQRLKGAPSHKVFSEFAHLKQKYWGQHLWARGYFVAATGTVTDEIIMDYIANQDTGNADDDFRIAL
jgi:putative transposase